MIRPFLSQMSWARSGRPPTLQGNQPKWKATLADKKQHLFLILLESQWARNSSIAGQSPKCEPKGPGNDHFLPWLKLVKWIWFQQFNSLASYSVEISWVLYQVRQSQTMDTDIRDEMPVLFLLCKEKRVDRHLYCADLCIWLRASLKEMGFEWLSEHRGSTC